MSVRINIGCGQTPTPGWLNFDNSFSLRLRKMPRFAALLSRLGFLGPGSHAFVRFAGTHDIRQGDATKGLPFATATVAAIYSCHMLEHLDREGANRFVREAYRLLQPGGILRLAVPDLRKLADRYAADGDADAFLASTFLCTPRPKSLAQRLTLLLAGPRMHQWMYDGASLTALLRRHDFVEVTVVPAGQTRIAGAGALDLRERESESVYVEAQKPSVD